MKKIPFTLLPPAALSRLAAHQPFSGLGNIAATLSPGLQLELLQAKNDYRHHAYASAAVAASLINALFVLALALIVSVRLQGIIVIGVAASLVVGAASFATIISYPRIMALQRARRLEKHLIPAMRQLLVQVKSGVPLFDGITSLTEGYGELSREFESFVKKVNAGVSMESALEEEARLNPSVSFRRILWQVSNTLKSGSDVGASLDAIVAELTRERIDEIRRYGLELNPLTMLYMLLAVIVPSLGITMGLVIASFLSVDVPSIIFAFVLAMMLGFQLLFSDLVSRRRPAVEF